MAQDLQLLYVGADDQKAYGFDFDLWLDSHEPGWTIDRISQHPIDSFVEDDWSTVELDQDGLLSARLAISRLGHQTFIDAADLVPVDWGLEADLLRGIAEGLYMRKNCVLNSIDNRLSEGPRP